MLLFKVFTCVVFVVLEIRLWALCVRPRAVVFLCELSEDKKQSVSYHPTPHNKNACSATAARRKMDLSVRLPLNCGMIWWPWPQRAR